MTDNLGLDYDEVVILKETGVAHGGIVAVYKDELILTNKRIICLSKGIFGGTKNIYHYPFDQIKVFNGIPQVKQGKLSNGSDCLEIYLVDGEESFYFQSKNKKTILLWIEEIFKLFGTDTGNLSPEVVESSFLDSFKKASSEFKDVGKEFAEVIGFKLKSKQNSNDSSVGGMNAAIRCVLCEKTLSPEMLFCPSCGISTEKKQDVQVMTQSALRIQREITCPICGKNVGLGLRFCTECGTEMTNRIHDDLGEILRNEITEKKLGIDQQIELLHKLKSLVDTGAISQEEFENKKKEILM